MTFSIDFHTEEKKNIRKSILLISVFFIMMASFGLIIDFVFGMLPIFTSTFILVACVHVIVSVVAGRKMVLSSVKAREANPNDAEEKQLMNIVEELSLAAGMSSLPPVYVVDDDDTINAFATGFKEEDGVICVTSGLLKKLDREETSGVIGHELSHIINRDILIMTLISALLGAVVMIQIIALRGLKYNLIFGGGRRKRSKNDSGAYIMILLAAVVGLATLFSFLGRLSLLAVSRTREYFADARSVELTRNPHGLSSALRKIAGTTKKMKTASVATAHLFIFDPLKRRINEKDSFFASLFSTHPPIAKRISVLENRPVEQVKKELYGRIS